MYIYLFLSLSTVMLPSLPPLSRTHSISLKT